MMNEEKAATDFVRFVSFLHSAFFLLHFAFRMSLLTSLRTKCYDPAGVGCYNFEITHPVRINLNLHQSAV